MSIAHMIGDAIRSRIITYTHQVFKSLGIDLHSDAINHDLAKLDSHSFEATFYITGVSNVPRKDFNLLAANLMQQHSQIKSFKVKYKRPDKEVRFFIQASENSE